MEPQNNPLKTIDVSCKGKQVQLKFSYEDETSCDVIISIPLSEAVDLHKKLDGAILKVLEDYHRL